MNCQEKAPQSDKNFTRYFTRPPFFPFDALHIDNTKINKNKYNTEKLATGPQV